MTRKSPHPSSASPSSVAYRCGPLAAALTLVLVALAGVAPAAPGDADAADRQARFDVRNEFQVTLPEGAKTVRAWFVLPQDVAEQTVHRLQVESPYPTREVTDAQGNRMLYLELERPEAFEFTLATTFQVIRREVRAPIEGQRAPFVTGEDKEGMAEYLKPSEHVIVDERIRQLAQRIVGEETDSIAAAEKIYEWVLDNIDYWVKDPANKKASGVGSTEYCLTTKTGNCTDFHALYTSLARGAGIPARMIYGSLFKTELAGLDVDQSYHCWLEFYAPGVGWVPVDVAVADIYVGDFLLTEDNKVLVRRTTADGFDPAAKDANMEKVRYYFGNLDERRVTWSLGRDLRLDPEPDAGPVNALPKAHIEVDGEVLPEGEGWQRTLTYTEL